MQTFSAYTRSIARRAKNTHYKSAYTTRNLKNIKDKQADPLA